MHDCGVAALLDARARSESKKVEHLLPCFSLAGHRQSALPEFRVCNAQLNTVPAVQLNSNFIQRCFRKRQSMLRPGEVGFTGLCGFGRGAPIGVEHTTVTCA